MDCDANAYERINQFALVSYLPEPLSTFLDRLRLELVPGCRPHAHVTVLPPRPLCVPVENALDGLSRHTAECCAFEVTLGDVQVFPVSDVLYVEIVEGERELHGLYERLNCDGASYRELFPYHPHVTVAQSIHPGEVQVLLEAARRKWAAYRGPRTFRVECLSFVQNTINNEWIDLTDLPMPVPTHAR